MKRWLRLLALPWLRRDPGEIARIAESFAIHTADGRQLVDRLGRAFLGGYNAMLEMASLRHVADAGAAVESHFRPFFFEGAAMGYLPRAWLWPGVDARRAERELLAMDPAFRYLYYVGIGFWMGIRHPARPAAVDRLAGRIEPLYFPLCYDGYGFKTAFFGFAKDAAAALSILSRCPAEHQATMRQGFGRALHFVFMDDEDGFQALLGGFPAAARADLETGRSLALAFTALDRPVRIIRHLAAARGESELGARLLGVTWALTAREMNDTGYFQSCLAGALPHHRALLLHLAEICRTALVAARDYAAWQEGTRIAALDAYDRWQNGEKTGASGSR